MITRVNLVHDIAQKNDVLSVGVSPARQLAAAVWTMDYSAPDKTVRVQCLESALERLGVFFPHFTFWLLCAHETKQPDNRLTRHRKLWQSFASRGFLLPEGKIMEEAIVLEDGGLRGFGLLQFQVEQLAAVYDIMGITQSAIALMPEAAALGSLPKLVRSGWPMKNTNPPEEILECVCPQAGLVIALYGEFDDPEFSVAAIGARETLHSFVG